MFELMERNGIFVCPCGRWLSFAEVKIAYRWSHSGAFAYFFASNAHCNLLSGMGGHFSFNFIVQYFPKKKNYRRKSRMMLLSPSTLLKKINGKNTPCSSIVRASKKVRCDTPPTPTPPNSGRSSSIWS